MLIYNLPSMLEIIPKTETLCKKRLNTIIDEFKYVQKYEL